MKRIAIFFDGTSNRLDADYQTNVVLLSRCVEASGFDNETQIVQYYQGVGTGRGSTTLAKLFDRALGGALAFGLIDIVEEAYRALAFVYEPGDDIYVFGFSRGAFTARVFTGLIRSCGIPPRRHLSDIPAAIKRHLADTPETHPDHPDSVAFRAWFAPETATSLAEQRERKDTSILLRLRYLGLWDTVKSFAVAQNATGATLKTPKFFHDLNLSSVVQSARHAMAVDERRSLYPVVPIANVAELNEKYPDAVPQFQQCWFPGNHGSVGGGGNRIGLSSIALRWVARGAERAGLRLNRAEIDRLAWHMDPASPLHNRVESLSLAESVLALLQADRPGPDGADALSVAAIDRYGLDANYRPPTLRMADAALDALSAEQRDALRREHVARDGGLTHWPGARYWLPSDDQTS